MPRTAVVRDITRRLPKPVSEAIRDGMTRAEMRDSSLKGRLTLAIYEAALVFLELTVDNVLTRYEANGGKDVNLDVLGPLMGRAAQWGWIKSTNRVQRSIRTQKHGNRHTIWRSLIYCGK